MNKYEIHLNSPDKLREALTAISSCSLDGAYRVTIEKLPQTRTAKQNRALHPALRQIAQELNDAGYSVKKTLKQDFEIPWNEALVKELMYRPIQMAMTEKESSTEVTKVEISDVYEQLNMLLSEKFGISVPFAEEK